MIFLSIWTIVTNITLTVVLAGSNPEFWVYLIVISQLIVSILCLFLCLYGRKGNTISNRQVSNEQTINLSQWVEQTLLNENQLCIGTLLDRLENFSHKERVQHLRNEINAERQCFQWVTKMYDIYFNVWKGVFIEQKMPIDMSKLPQMRSLLAEIALHSMDFLRYRMGDVNISEGNLVNPRLILLQKQMSTTDLPLCNDNPMEVPREARVLASFFQHDGITLNNASIQGYKQQI